MQRLHLLVTGIIILTRSLLQYRRFFFQLTPFSSASLVAVDPRCQADSHLITSRYSHKAFLEVLYSSLESQMTYSAGYEF